MKKDRHFHLFNYLVLVVLLLFGISTFFFFAGNKNMQFLIVLATSALYFLWGVFHHTIEGDLHPKIVVEYLLIALLSIFLMRGLLF